MVGRPIGVWSLTLPGTGMVEIVRVPQTERLTPSLREQVYGPEQIVNVKKSGSHSRGSEDKGNPRFLVCPGTWRDRWRGRFLNDQLKSQPLSETAPGRVHPNSNGHRRRRPVRATLVGVSEGLRVTPVLEPVPSPVTNPCCKGSTTLGTESSGLGVGCKNVFSVTENSPYRTTSI